MDRNNPNCPRKSSDNASLSARRAWIEIYDGLIASANFCVALRKESVDRNSIGPASFRACITSLSARRAWIEILVSARQVCLICVALRKESVDRNTNFCPAGLFDLSGRSPQGERG